MSGVPAIARLRDVYKLYGQGEALVRALDSVNLTIRAGEMVAVMGSSGSGKSTAMNLLGALDSPTSGEYLFDGVDVATMARDERAILWRHFLGFIFQSFNLLARTSAVENVELPLIYQGVRRGERRRRALEVLSLVGILDRAHHTPAQLSGGQQQRVAIARAIVTNPKIILADEPTGNLDSARSEEILAMLASLNSERGITVVMVTHEPEAAQYAQRVVWFADGKVTQDGTPAQVLS